jgi:hypothetical protein
MKFSLLTNRSRIADERKSLLNSLYILEPFIYYGILIDFPPEFLLGILFGGMPRIDWTD